MSKKKLLPQTPSQTVGPYFAYGLTPEQYHYDFRSWVDNRMVDPNHNPDAITIMGKVLDGESVPVPDAMIEIWQDNGAKPLVGRFGTGTDPENRFIFHTIKPPAQEGQAPFATIIVFMRGQLIHSFTRLYFSDETELNAQDPVLQSMPQDRRNTLIARKKGNVYQFDIYMQGEQETIFFEM